METSKGVTVAQADLLYLVKVADWAAGQGFCDITGIDDPEEWCLRKWSEAGPPDGAWYSADALAAALAHTVDATDGERVWEALKGLCCADPENAKRCIMVSRDDLFAALHQPAAEADEVGRRLLADAFETLVYIFECSEDEQASRTAKEAADKIEGFLALNRADNAEG